MFKNIFLTKNIPDFNELALEIFYLQAKRNPVYKKYLQQLNIHPQSISEVKEIPFLPIEFFKTKKILTEGGREKTEEKKVFYSSGTTSEKRSKHYVSVVAIYEKSFTKIFEEFYGNAEDYCLLALLPSYLEQKNSSLVYMTNHLIKKTKNKHSGFYLNNLSELSEKLIFLEKKKQKTILLGVSFALLDFSEKFPMKLKHTIIMETGGMKGRKKEIIREELHKKLCKVFGVKTIHSEYGMTELLSQAYSKGNGIFHSPPWMKIFIRDVNDNFQTLEKGQTGGINIIDLANINSCSFIATQDLGKLNADGSFEVLGRFDNSDLRGCSLMV